MGYLALVALVGLLGTEAIDRLRGTPRRSI
jgi:hypothetical protein